ncbi:MAG: glycerol-3-phosphate 1-O-acyltransferase PlsY [Lachnospiraceae bacterium]|nr:glycerol-3-phosphate 1-O-acyltransferase PlsY [Lachnospiraceae bacterium]
MPVLIRLILLIVGYAFGLFQTGYFYGKITGNDLRKEGSGNTGATNALRTHGFKAAFLIFFFDALKAFIPCFAVRLIFREDSYRFVYIMYTALGVILGNDYPVYLKFKGGKGVAATCGYAFAWQWMYTLIGLALFFSIAFLTGYVSLASISASVFIFLCGILFGFAELGGPGPVFFEFVILIAVLQFLLVWRHRTNIVRLVHGTENRFGHKKKAAVSMDTAADKAPEAKN